MHSMPNINSTYPHARTQPYNRDNDTGKMVIAMTTIVHLKNMKVHMITAEPITITSITIIGNIPKGPSHRIIIIITITLGMVLRIVILATLMLVPLLDHLIINRACPICGTKTIHITVIATMAIQTIIKGNKEDHRLRRSCPPSTLMI